MGQITAGRSTKKGKRQNLAVVTKLSAKERQGAEWYKLCRPHLEWVNWSPQLDVEKYAEQLVSRARAMNSDTLVYPWESGGYVLYPGDLAPPYENLGGADLFGTLVKRSHEAGLRFMGCFLGVSANTYLTNAHPDWVQTDKAGKLIERWHGYNFRSLCPNSPYGQDLYWVARDLLKRYPLDGIYIEGVYMGSGYCYCPYCRDMFRQRFGREMPEDRLEADVEYNQFRQGSVTSVFRRIREAIDETRPEAVLFACLGYTYYFGKQGDSARRLRDLADVICIESQWNYDLPGGYDPSFAPSLMEIGMILELMRAEGGKPVLGTVWIAKHVDQNYAPRTEANVTLNFQELLVHGAIPQVHTQNALEADPKLMPLLRRVYGYAEKVMPYLKDSRIVAHTAILDWADVRSQHRVFDDSLKGAYKAMLEQHIPTRFTTPKEIISGGSLDYQVLLLADAAELHDDVIEGICEFVSSGGGLVMTYQSILANKRLAEIGGVRYSTSLMRNGKAFPLHTYYRIDSAEPHWKDLSGTLMSYVANHEVVECERDVNVIGQVLGLDPGRRSEKHILQVCYPGEPVSPLITSRQVGKGRVIYIAAELCAAARRYGDANTLDVLAAAVKHAGRKDVPVTTNCPPCVEIVTHRSEKGLAVMLLNGTTNQYMADPVRYIVPINGVEIRIALDDLSAQKPNVSTVSGQKANAKISERRLEIKLARLAEYEGVLIDF